MRPFGAMALEMLSDRRPDGPRHRRTARGTPDFSRDPRPKSEILRTLGRAHGGDEHTVGEDPAAAFPGDDEGLRPVRGQGARSDPLRHRQRDPSPRPGVCLSAGARHRAAAVLRADSEKPGGVRPLHRGRGRYRGMQRFALFEGSVGSGSATSPAASPDRPGDRQRRHRTDLRSPPATASCFRDCDAW